MGTAVLPLGWRVSGLQGLGGSRLGGGGGCPRNAGPAAWRPLGQDERLSVGRGPGPPAAPGPGRLAATRFCRAGPACGATLSAGNPVGSRRSAAGGGDGRRPGRRARGRRAHPVPARRPREVPGENSGDRGLKDCEGREPAMAEALGDPRVPGEIPLLEPGCKETGRDPVELPRGSGLSPPVPRCGEAGDSPARTLLLIPPGKGPGEARVSHERQGKRFSFLSPFAKKPVSLREKLRSLYGF